MNSRFPYLAAMALSLAVLIVPSLARSEPAAPGCELGLRRALAGDTASAHAIFRSLLAKNARKACALANLGNLMLISGRPRAAHNYYLAASWIDPSDPGLLLNIAIAHAMACEDSLALVFTERALRQVGDAKKALDLLGIRSEAGAPRRAGDISSRLLQAIAPNCGKPLDAHLVQTLMERASRRLAADSLRQRAAGGEFPIASYPLYWMR